VCEGSGAATVSTTSSLGAVRSSSDGWIQLAARDEASVNTLTMETERIRLPRQAQ
jgi:hypothetical protein